MSLYLYPEDWDTEPFCHSSTTSRLLLRIIRKWQTPDLWNDDPREGQEDATAYVGFYTPSDISWRENLYHRHAFVLAHANVPRTLETFIPWIKDNWEQRKVFEFGMEVGAGEITREIYADTMKLLDKIVAAETHVRAI